MIHKKVRFKGEVYWLHETFLGGQYNLSPLEHYDEKGELQLDNPYSDISFAVIQDDIIWQWAVQIGTIADLEDV